MSDELKPARCGCGGEAIVAPYHGDGYESFYVYCQKCNIETDYYEFEDEAIMAWNRVMGNRVQLHTVKERTAKVKNIAHVRGYPPEGECGNCGFDVIDDGEYCPGCGAKLDWSDDE